MESKWYRIRQVAERTGLSPQLIRKWEERYHAVEPRRLENGYRVYREEDIHRLEQLKRLVEGEGYSIKHAVLYLEDHVQSKTVQDGTSRRLEMDASVNHDNSPLTVSPAVTISDETADAEDIVAGLLCAGANSDTTRMNAILNRTYFAHGMYFVVYSVILPFLREVGELWEAGTWSEYQEHIASNQVRDFLVNARLRVPENTSNRRLLASCVPGERHDIMLQIVLLEAAVRGWKAHFLGISPAETALEDAIAQLDPQVVVLSVSTPEPLLAFPDWIHRVESTAREKPYIHFFVGGPEDVRPYFPNETLTWISSVQELFQRVRAF